MPEDLNPLLPLLEPISADHPCGRDEWVNVDTLLAPLAGDRPRWNDLLAKCEQAFRGELETASKASRLACKDMRIAVYIARAMVALYGVKGLRDSLEFINKLLDIQGLFPASAEKRINVLQGLCPSIGGLQEIPMLLCKAPLTLEADDGRFFSLRDIDVANGKRNALAGGTPPISGDIDAAFVKTGRDHVASLRHAAVQAANHLRLTIAFMDRPENKAFSTPNFETLGKAIQAVTDELTERESRLPAPTPEDTQPLQSKDSAVRSFGAATSSVASRDDVIRLLDQVYNYYLNREPSSLIVQLVQQTRKWVGKSYVEILGDLNVELKDGIPTFTLTISGKEKKEKPK